MSLTASDEIRIRNLEKSVGQPGSEHSKSLFEIVAALNKEVLDLKLKIEEMELKEKHYERDQTQNQRNDRI